MRFVFVFVVLVVCCQSTKLPSNFKKCNRKDPDVQKCTLEAAQSVIPQLTKPYPEVKMPNLAPLEIIELRMIPGSENVVNVEQIFKNCKLYGLTGTKLKNCSFDFDKRFLYASGVIGEVKKICDYELDGKVLLLPIEGAGRSTIILKNLNFTYYMDYEELKKKKSSYVHFTSQRLKLDPEVISFNFENLFQGDKQLGDNINKVLNENYKEVYADVRGNYEEAIGLVVRQIFNNFFSKVSIEEAFD